MGAPKENQFWKNRSKHGRNKLFKEPEELWKAACEYFQWCDENPWYKTDFKGKDVLEVQIPTQRPYTLAGLCFYCNASRSWWNDFKKNADKDFLVVINNIEDVMYSQKFEGAAVGAFSPTIIARDLGLKESSEIDHTTGGDKITQEIDYSKLSSEALKEIANQMNESED